MPFYAALGVTEVIVCHRDSKQPEIFRLAGSQYFVLQAGADGSLVSSVLGIRLRQVSTTPPRLRIADAAERSIHVEI